MSLAAFSRLHGGYGTDFVPGVDVSGHQTPAQLAEALGWARYAWIKATQGVHFYEHAETAALVDVCRQRGVPYGLYHFANQRTVDGVPVFANNDPKAEAGWFATAIMRQGGPGQLPPVLDYEAGGAPGDQSGWTLAFLAELERLIGRRPMFYSYVGWIKAHLRHGDLAQYPLWLAHYSSPGVDAETPRPWWEWQVWQYQQETAEHGHLDVNVARPAWLVSVRAAADDGFGEEDRRTLHDLLRTLGG